MRSGLRLAVLGCLAGSALVLLALSLVWVSYEVTAAAPLPTRTVRLRGASLVPGARALGLLGLAAVAALLATRSRGRQVVGALVVLTGAGIAVAVGRALADAPGAVSRAASSDVAVSQAADLGPWPYLGLLGALLLTAAGALATLRGHRWAGLAARYDGDRPAASAQPDPWTALDRGEDPTRAS